MTVRSTYRFARIPEWVLLHPDLEPLDVCVFGVLDRFDGKACFPSLSTIGERIGRSEDSIRRSIRRLEAAGAVVVEHRAIEGRQTSNEYHLAGDAPMQGRPGTDATPEGGTDARGEGGTDATRSRASNDPEQEEPLSRPAPLAIADGRFDLFWGSYPRKTKKPDAAKAFRAAMKRFDHEDILDGLARWKTYWQERNESQFIPYPATFLRGEQWKDDPPAAQSKIKTNPGLDILRKIREAEGR